MPTNWATLVRESISYDVLTGKLFWIKRGRGVQFNKEPGCVNKIDGYRVVGVGRRIVKVHNLIWFLHYDVWPTQEVDHINRNPLDNRIDNLRLATRKENARNRKNGHGNHHGFKGVSYEKKRKKWLASIRVDGILKYLGRYNDIIDAAKAYDKAAITYFGDFACLNLTWEVKDAH